MKAKFLALAIVLGMVSVSPALGDSILLDGSDSPVNLGPFNVGDTFTLTVGFEFMPALTTTDSILYIVGEIAVEAEISFYWDPTKLSLFNGDVLVNGGFLVTFDALNGIATFDLYAPSFTGNTVADLVTNNTSLTLEFQALMVTDPTTEIFFTGEGFYDPFNCDPGIPGCGVVAVYDDLVSHDATPNTANVTIVPEPATILLLGSGLLVGGLFRKRFKG